MFPFKKYSIKNYDFSLLTLVFALCILGVYLVRIAQPGLFLKQIMGLGLGLFIVAVVSIIDYHFISQFYIVLYFINLVLLVAVKLFGVEHHNSRRWLNLIVFEFQPSELTKIILIIFMAKLLVIFKERMGKFYVLILLGVLIGIPTFLILTQTNLSTSLVILFIFAIMVFAGGLSLKIILPIVLTVIPIVIGTLWGIQNNYDIFFLTNYQQSRIVAFMNPESEQSSDTLYQQQNSVEVIGSGKLTGKLFTEGKDAIQSDTYVPISESDFIFSVAGESLGFIGGCVIIVLLSIIIFKCLIIASHAPDRLGRLIAVGISAMFVFQMFVNIGVATKILPNTGIPLPFVSYGLSSMMSSMIAIGIIININLQKKFRRG
ncbi:FtsW/RodA/SpoVE family cell cycle protein [Anaerocolumna xylanovorans]|uniref:Rod shape determining protein RodA n=1 Tax=Anaerocolumna xylanovorans DSM 12503 TaxID=1121345 RepID=A0A1M7Y2G5_9FIRM|nr:FtsW/RodA/SpoVE family cell cycle protein [Anaerocolumna xylanovorans]SHO45899.1 rod shape determining protein RodA [Anaerocolumna xylanovorans DSM 12503]